MNSQRLSQLNANCNQKKMEKSVYYFNQNRTPQQSLIDTSIFSSVMPPSYSGGLNPNSSIMQGTLQNMNEMSFAPSAQQQQQQASTMYASVNASQFRSPVGVTQMSQMRRPQPPARTPMQQQNVESIFISPNVTEMPSSSGFSTPGSNNVMFNSGDLVDDIEEADNLEESQKEPNMMDIFVGKNKK
jgi:hypothetical protein